jgi:hypothetical protein
MHSAVSDLVELVGRGGHGRKINFIYPENSWIGSSPFRPFVKGRRYSTE